MMVYSIRHTLTSLKLVRVLTNIEQLSKTWFILQVTYSLVRLQLKTLSTHLTQSILNAQNVESETRFNFNPTIIIKGTPTYYLEMENASRDNYQTTAERDDNLIFF